MTLPFAPISVNHRTDALSAIKRRREQMGLSGEQIDHDVGLTRGHSAKIENGHKPWGKIAFAMTPSFSWILRRLGLMLILVDEETGKALVGEVEVKEYSISYQPRGERPYPSKPAGIVSYEWPASL